MSASASHPILSAIDWKGAFDEATGLLQELIRLETVNAPDREVREIEAARLLEARFADVDLDSVVLESAPGRGNVVTRLKGDGSGGAPIMLSAHLDVVPADPSGWTHPPFAAEIHDGVLYGRGAVDMLNMAAMSAMCVLLLKRAGVTLKRDLIFVGVADEEAGSEYGSLWLAEHHPSLVTAEHVFSEIGGFTMDVGGTRFYPVQVAEKGIGWLTIRATGTPGHGSIPAKDNPIVKIARAAELLGTRRLPYHRTPVVERFVRELAAHTRPPNSIVLKGLLRRRLSAVVLDRIFPDPGLAGTFDAALHNTANPTVVSAGGKINQVPGHAELKVDGRLLPGQTAADLVREVRALIGPGYDITVDRELPGVTVDPDHPMMDRIRAAIARSDPEGIVVPTLIPGFTDAKAWSKLGAHCWGFSPVRLPADVKFASLFHGHDERIPVEGFHWGLKALFDLVTDLVL
jgi:acetylornithine deacetylase/succinyl-diaminopimelate desuccinylase-like protein